MSTGTDSFGSLDTNDSGPRSSNGPAKLVLVVFVAFVLSVTASLGFLKFQGHLDRETPAPVLYEQLQDTAYAHLRAVQSNMILNATFDEYVMLTRQEPNPIQANEEGLYPLPIGRTIVLGFLYEDTVMMPKMLFANQIWSSLEEIPQNANVYGRIGLTLTMLPNTEIEESWQQEEIFNDSLLELFNNDSVTLERTMGILMVKRNDASLSVPESIDVSVLPVDLVVGERVFFTRVVAGVLIPTTTGVVAKILDGDENTFVVIETVFSLSDYPTPVYVERDGKLVWIGNLADGTVGFGLLIPAETVSEIATSVK